MANLATPGRWLRHKKNGTIYPWNPHLAPNPAVEEVPGELAFPERFQPVTQKGRKAEVDLGTSEEAVEKAEEPKAATKPALAADAKKGLEKGRK